MKVLKIKTLKGKILTLNVKEQTDTHYIGVDKFGEDVIISIYDIDSLKEIKG